MSEFKLYKSIQTKEIRPYKKGEDLKGVGVPEGIDPAKDKGYIARDPNNHEDQWYVSKVLFKDNFVLAEKVDAEGVEELSDAEIEKLYAPFKILNYGIPKSPSSILRVITLGLQNGRGVMIQTIVQNGEQISNDLEFLPEARIIVDDKGNKIIV